jgi:hypothetical protein
MNRPSNVKPSRPSGSVVKLSAAVAGLGAAAYGAYAALTWLRYGCVARAASDEVDPLLDRFLPRYDVVERHAIPVAAPAPVVLDTAREQQLFSIPLVRWVFRGRELMMRSTPAARPLPPGLLDQMRLLGWVVLAEEPDRELVVGAVTKPWEANVVFRGIPADAFASFNEPGYVKIVWTLRADPTGVDSAVFRTETRALATDDEARRRFRVYWSLASPGIWLIRRLSLRPLQRAAEARSRLQT